MTTVECQRKECKHFGIDLCIKSRVHHDKSGMCIDFAVNDPTEINITKDDLRASFKPNCERARGIYRECRIKKVFT